MVIFQMNPHVNQTYAQIPSVLQLIPCHMIFYTFNAILFFPECLQPSLKGYLSQVLK
jgi:hypothetical protein